MRFFAGVCGAIAISAVGMVAATFAEAPVPSQAQAKNLMEDVTATGCIRAWKPAPEDVTRQPENREPGIAGIFLLTPLASGRNSSIALQTYLLTPTQVANFAQHLDDTVEVVGVAQAAPMAPTVQESVAGSIQRPENKPNTESLPRLTIRSLKKVSDSCP